MNISLWNFKPSSASLGTLTDKLSGNTVAFSGSSRHQQLITSVGHTVMLTLEHGRTENDAFILEVTGKLHLKVCNSVHPILTQN